jgi:uncharacterized membrane protein
MQIIVHSRHAQNISESERWFCILSGSALAAYGFMRGRAAGWALALAGGELLRTGASGWCAVYAGLGINTAARGQGAETTSVPYQLGIRVDRADTVDRPRQEVYAFWRRLENLPRFMRHLESVATDGLRSHWVARAPAGRTVEWDAVIHSEVANERIAWRSLPGSKVAHAGAVIFSDAPGGRGTEVRVELQYNPPAGPLGAVVAKLWGEEPDQQIREDLHRFKQILETGEIPTVEGQPSGRDRRAAIDRAERSAEVQYASELSFPASDPPSYGH